jgi:hypothetical protein
MPLSPGQQEAIERYVATGGYDSIHWERSGGLVEGGRQAANDLTRALLAEVERRSRDRRPPSVPQLLDVEGFTRSKIEPMVRGLFPPGEREAVLAVLERSVVFITEENLAPLLRSFSFLSTAWDVANLYLTSVGAEPLSSEAPAIVGLSEEAKCYVSTEYFSPGSSRFADFVLHETAHIFHNCKRRTVGLPERGRREWLLDIDFRMRETFAYACEAYGRILELGSRPSDQRELLSQLLDGPMPSDDRVDENDYRDILTAAVAARSGWRFILRRCAPSLDGRLGRRDSDRRDPGAGGSPAS